MTAVLLRSPVGSGNRRNRGAVLAPAELATIDPHPVQNYSQTPGDRDDRSMHPASLSHPHAPRLQPRPFPPVRHQYISAPLAHLPHPTAAPFGPPPPATHP